MEGEADKSNHDVQGEERATVLWEKCFQQSIFVDLSEDESLHLSDLEGSLALHLSQADSAASEASVHLSGSAELSALEVSSTESSSVSSQSESMNQGCPNHLSGPRPNTMQDQPHLNQGFDDAGQNTSDEDQDDLPYDGDLGNLYFSQTTNSEHEQSSDGRETVHSSPDPPGFPEPTEIEKCYLGEHLASDEHEAEKAATLFQVGESHNAPKPSDFSPSFPADINQVLLRHFSQEELLWSGRLIEAETLPEVSLLESVDDTVTVSVAPALNSIRGTSNLLGSLSCNREDNLSIDSDSTAGKSDSASQHSSQAVRKADNNSSTHSSDSKDSTQASSNTSAFNITKQEISEEDDQVQRVPLIRTRSFSEMKYGQGQVHYPLPDFSKVASKVKIPKAPSGPSKAVPPTPGTMHRAQSSPGMLDVISRVLEDSIQVSEKPCVFKEENQPAPPALVHHLQAEYDKLLTKYAEAENLIDQMRIGVNTQASSDLVLDLEWEDDHQRNLPQAEGSHLGSLAALHLSSGEQRETACQGRMKEGDTASCSQPEESPSDGERMTAELMDIITQFMQKVEEFRLSVNSMSMSAAEQHMMLRSLMEAQDQLERKYIGRKDEHRALEMQNYMGLCRNTGAFDPNRQVEGDIFRIGMHLEDIKETIDKKMCEQISPPHSSSTPTHMKEMLHVKPSANCVPTPSASPSPSLHEGPRSGLSTVGCRNIEVEETEGQAEDVSEAHKGIGSVDLITTESLLMNAGHSSNQTRSSLGSLKGMQTNNAEAEDERSSVLSGALDHSNILAYFNEGSSSLGQRQRTHNSQSTQDLILSPVGDCDLGDCTSLAVEVSSSCDPPRDSCTPNLTDPPVSTSSASQVQRFVSPETDSGFGSSYLHQSSSGSFQPNQLTDSVQSQNDGLSSSDSEDSCSNLRTTIHPVNLSSQRWASPHPSIHTETCGAAAAVERWVESTTKEPLVQLDDSELNLSAQLHHHTSEPVLSIAMETEERGSRLNSCSCNSEVIIALQSEVSRLKKDLEEGLVQLPHLAQKMDLLTSRYRKDCQERRSKTRHRTHHRLASSSMRKSSSCRQSGNNLSSRQVRMEDWISSDMDPSKSKGTDSGGDTEIMLQFHSPPAGSRRGSDSVNSLPEHHNKVQSQGGSEGRESVKTSALGSPLLKEREKEYTESFSSKKGSSLFSSSPLQKPLLQVSYGSSSSLPASYKVRELPLQSTPHHRKRSTQSDTALLPSNVYFQQTLTAASAPSKAGRRTGRRRGSKEEEINRTLDQAIEVALNMKRTTERMAKRLSADLAQAQVQRKLHNIQPLGGRRHHAL